MKLTFDKSEMLKKASDSLLFDDLLSLVLLMWPEKIDTSVRKYVDYEKMQGVIEGLSELEERNEEFFEGLEIENLLTHLNHALVIAVNKIGLLENSVSKNDINKDYVRYLFENKCIAYAIEPIVENIPLGLRGNLEYTFDKELIEKYFQNKA